VVALLDRGVTQIDGALANSGADEVMPVQDPVARARADHQGDQRLRVALLGSVFGGIEGGGCPPEGAETAGRRLRPYGFALWRRFLSRRRLVSAEIARRSLV